MNRSVSLVENISLLAKKFREAIDQAAADKQFNWKYDLYHMDRMSKFPEDCCDDTCDLLWHYLFSQHSMVLQQVSCNYGEGNARHNWLEMDDIIIDLTGDQFVGRPSVFVGKDDGFYAQMTDRRLMEPYCIENDKRLWHDYEIIIGYIK